MNQLSKKQRIILWIPLGIWAVLLAILAGILLWDALPWLPC